MVRVGAGTGYYMVIMAHLVFSTDKVLLSNTDRAWPAWAGQSCKAMGAVPSFRALLILCRSMPVSRTRRAIG
jgi:hypothetical protein